MGPSRLGPDQNQVDRANPVSLFRDGSSQVKQVQVDP